MEKHGPWCNTRVWPTKCYTCREQVFFFTCNHGSEVFFDELGPPWPIHDCDISWTRKLKRTTDQTGKITVELGEGITISRVPNSFQIDKKIIHQVRRSKEPEKPAPFIAIEPEKETTCSVIGILREIILDACPFKKYGLPDTPIGRAMLNQIAKQKMGRITVHVPPSTGIESKSFSLWIPFALIQDRRITRGRIVSLTLETVKIHKHGYVWFSDEFDVRG